MFYTYILYSEKLNSFYKGSTNDVFSRLERHNNNYENFTSKGSPWELIWITKKQSKSEAVTLEFKLKNLSKKRTDQFVLKFKEDLNPKLNPQILEKIVSSNHDEII